LQFIQTSWVNCVYNPEAGPLGLVLSGFQMKYFLEIADVMGFVQSIATEMISPLRFMGQSVDLAVEFYGQGLNVWIDPMPIIGVTAPADWHMAWSQSIAENLGSYAIFRSCGMDRLHSPTFRLFLPNQATTGAYFSSPRHVMALLTRRVVREFFNLQTAGEEFLLIASKAPDAQAAMEKTAGALLGRLFGFAGLEGAGGLWLDEIFSPQQLVIDIEIKSFVNSVGADLSGVEADVVEVVRAGVRQGSFLASDMTLDRFAEFTWPAGLSDLRPRAAWDGDHQTLLRKAAAFAEEKAREYTYELTDSRREQLDRILERARNELAGRSSRA
jgi:trimethylamine:corrinoid methyltransferase-like protein